MWRGIPVILVIALLSLSNCEDSLSACTGDHCEITAAASESMASILRTIRRIGRPQKQSQWGGFIQVMTPTQEEFDPFIFLVHHVHSFRAGERAGFPPHPHRGFETVTYILQGAFDHGDSRGNKGRYGDGDVQWMTAGKGVLHSEMFVTNPDNTSTFDGFQLWVNLPASLKMSEPDYRMLYKNEIPRAVVEEKEGPRAGQVASETRIIAGEYAGLKSSIQKSVPMSVMHAVVRPSSAWEFTSPRDHNVFAYVFAGSGRVVTGGDARPIQKGEYVLFGNDGETVKLENTAAQDMEFMFLEGQPFKEPFAHQGPFVMNTQKELRQAFLDFQKGDFGYMDEPAEYD